MPNLLTRKLELFGPLSASDRRILDEVVANPRDVERHTDLVREGESPSDVRLILDGFACRYKILEDGRRQIMAYLLPGDACDFQVFILRAMDHSIATLTRSQIVDIPRSRILELSDRPAIARALWWTALVDVATIREWLVNLGQRNADVRIAHLFCELHLRLHSIGLAEADRFSLPITQAELGDTMGLSAVHVNRSLQSLRSDNLITFNGKELVIRDLRRLREISGFNPNYLHLGGGKHDHPKLNSTK